MGYILSGSRYLCTWLHIRRYGNTQAQITVQGPESITFLCNKSNTSATRRDLSRAEAALHPRFVVAAGGDTFGRVVKS